MINKSEVHGKILYPTSTKLRSSWSKLKTIQHNCRFTFILFHDLYIIGEWRDLKMSVVVSLLVVGVVVNSDGSFIVFYFVMLIE